jgi:hypothetical protein
VSHNRARMAARSTVVLMEPVHWWRDQILRFTIRGTCKYLRFMKPKRYDLISTIGREIMAQLVLLVSIIP